MCHAARAGTMTMRPVVARRTRGEAVAHTHRGRPRRADGWLAARPLVACPLLIAFGLTAFLSTAGLTCAATNGCKGSDVFTVARVPTHSPHRASPVVSGPPATRPVFAPGSAPVRVAPPRQVRPLPPEPVPAPQPPPSSAAPSPAPGTSQPSSPPSPPPSSSPPSPPPSSSPPPTTEPPTPTPTDTATGTPSPAGSAP